MIAHHGKSWPPLPPNTISCTTGVRGGQGYGFLWAWVRWRAGADVPDGIAMRLAEHWWPKPSEWATGEAEVIRRTRRGVVVVRRD